MQRVTDPVTGLEVRVLAGAQPGDVSVELSDRVVAIRQAYVGGRALTVLTTPGEQISVTLGLDGISLTGPAGRVVASRHDPAQLAALARVLGASTAVHRATDLLGRIRLGNRSPIGHVLLLTRAMLQSATGEHDAGLALSRWAQTTSAALRVRRAAFEDGPGDCWDEYAQEAIEAYSEYEDCMQNTAWWNLLGADDCAALYDLRALGAFSWWVTCVGIRG
jgi:hypothetical protein